ncbi:FtsB family cell division protein [Rubrivirga sp. IMCC45206]|uniref:FtsB family cell division protein n=1 Tax=Rubrivirga sp. IMCC45206 TaxID=3391614 RepID=UPI00398FAF7A
MTTRLRRRALLVGLVGLALWVAFFDSHSVLRRIGYARELDRLTEENAALEAENATLSDKLEDGLDDATLERVAREEYGMRRPGERVYRVEAAD